MKITIKKLLQKKAIVITMASLIALPAVATETIKAVVIDGYPAKAMWVDEFSNFFIPQVNERLAKTNNYKIDWQESYGGTIVKPKGVLDGIKLGLGDIGIVTTVFHNSKLPSQSLAAVTPFVSVDARVVAKAMDEITKEFPTMEKEFSKQKQVYLATGVVLNTYQIFSKERIESIKDLEGGKVAGAGIILRYLDGINNAAGVRGGLTDFYNMLSTGLVDHAMLWPEAAKTFKIAEVAPFMLKADLGAVNSKTVTANSRFWKKLPDEVKQVIQEVAVEYRDHIAEIAMDRAQESLDAYIAAGGTVVTMSQEARKEWADSMPNLAAEWAAGLDKKGEPGTEMLRAYMGKLTAAGFTPARDWAAGLK
ncbi:C4-dicarboxylate TRAP transporter substrate-binding protein [Marinomonas colpomeniae]|uniref:C4-dicarboxylate TRAP transporter substrate-binding protein n=1 Tax=Marinomonas colpomeniae TaxID=2774408 RepID=A0ABR8NW48_9GAMM|nr:C4-dicarboxylate TRAP transporter substrate-binding protein [Marinomonas colpomeniae]MBD5770276.1 C4-dicarboxylate TRAP transporter substrate-binding protein [Marinomonas colpomeniae]